MTKRFTLTVEKKYVTQIEAVQKACDMIGISFSKYVVKAAIKEFEEGRLAKLMDEENKK